MLCTSNRSRQEIFSQSLRDNWVPSPYSTLVPSANGYFDGTTAEWGAGRLKRHQGDKLGLTLLKMGLKHGSNSSCTRCKVQQKKVGSTLQSLDCGREYRGSRQIRDIVGLAKILPTVARTELLLIVIGGVP